MSDALLQFLAQVPLVAAFIYYALEQGKQAATERRERTDLWIEDSRNRETQWREFIRQRDEQWSSVLLRIQESMALSQAAVIKELETCESHIDILAGELKATNARLQIIEYGLQEHVSTSRRGKTGTLKAQAQA